MSTCGYEFYLLVLKSISQLENSKTKLVFTCRHVTYSIAVKCPNANFRA